MCVCVGEKRRVGQGMTACMNTHVYRCEAVGVQFGTNLLHVILLISECNPFIVKPPEHVQMRQRKV